MSHKIVKQPRRLRENIHAYDVKRSYWALRLSHALCSNPSWCKPYSLKHYMIYLQICIPLDVNQHILDEVWIQEERNHEIQYQRAVLRCKLEQAAKR